MTPSRQDIALGILFILAGVMIFFFGKLSVHTPEEIRLPDNSLFEKRIDSLAAENQKLKNINKALFVSFDSLKLVRAVGLKKHSNETKEIKNFTPSARNRWRDSVAKAESLR